MLDKKKKILLVLAALFGVGTCVVMFFMLQKKEKNPNEDLMPVLEESVLSSDEQQYRDENVSLFEDTVSPADDVMSLVQRIDVTNMEVMSERGYSQESIDSLIPYLDAYFDYFDPEGDNYTAKIGPTAGNNEEYPHFYLIVDMNGTDFWIDCFYAGDREEYIFYSDFGDPFEN